MVDRYQAEIEKMYRAYSAPLDPSVSVDVKGPHQAPEKEVVLLTGSTGALGSNILARLLQDPRVEHVWAVNRSGGSQVVERQTQVFLEQGLDVGLLATGKVAFVKGDLTKHDFGLDDDVFDELLRTTTSVIHNAWMVNWKLPFAAFEPLIAGTRNLVDFVRLCNGKIFFTSSIFAMQAWDKSRGTVPEAIITDHSIAVGGGYGSSKYVSERIIADSGLPGCSFRIGQITGGKASGAWSTTEWFPMLVQASIKLGVRPEVPGVASWIQMDHVAARITDTVLDYYKISPPPVINVVHPNPIPVDDIALQMSDILVDLGITSQRLLVQSFDEWFKLLEKTAQSITCLDDLPAAKILPFYRGLAYEFKFIPKDCKEETLGLPNFTTSGWTEEVPSIDASNMRKWLGFWKSQRFI